jgi:hypothetical protein
VGCVASSGICYGLLFCECWYFMFSFVARFVILLWVVVWCVVVICYGLLCGEWW